MLYDIRFTIAASYDAIAPYARHVLRVGLHDWPGQRVQSQTVRIEPEPADNAEAWDFFGNVTRWITIPAEHSGLIVAMAARVARETPIAPDDASAPPWTEVCVAAANIYDLSPTSPAHFLFPSRLIAPAPEIGAYAALSFAGDVSVLAGARDLMRRIHADFTYDAAATHVRTTPAEAFALKRGVCQDFTHVMIAGLRELGLPARYMSGFIRTRTAAGAPQLEGADATHAWVAIWCGEDLGWVGLDPTNAIDEGEAHILIGAGRDYADVAPLDGVILTHGPQSLNVAVDVAPVAE